MTDSQFIQENRHLLKEYGYNVNTLEGLKIINDMMLFMLTIQLILK